MNRTQPKHFAKYICCSLFGYNLYLYAINIYNHFLPVPHFTYLNLNIDCYLRVFRQAVSNDTVAAFATLYMSPYLF